MADSSSISSSSELNKSTNGNISINASIEDDEDDSDEDDDDEFDYEETSLESFVTPLDDEDTAPRKSIVLPSLTSCHIRCPSFTVFLLFRNKFVWKKSPIFLAYEKQFLH